MQYELVSRALAYVSCLSTLGLFATSMAIAAVNVGKTPAVACSLPACMTSPAQAHASGIPPAAHLEAVAQAMWAKKI